MKYFYSTLCLLFSLSLFAQDGNPVAEKIAEHHRQNDIFERYDLFSETNITEKSEEYKDAAKDAVVFHLEPAALNRLLSEKPEVLEISFPYKEGEITVELFKKEIFTEGFQAVDQNKKPLDYEPGVYYRGIVKNDPLSIVAFSFFKEEVIGVASALGTGNVVVGKVKEAAVYISYTDYTITGPNPFRCGTESLPENQKQQHSSDKKTTSAIADATPSCVRIYYEIAYQPYVDNGMNSTATLNWLTAVHNNIATLYANDNIQIALSDILLWTTQDPYVYNYSGNLSYFSNYRSAFNGDLGHLVNSPSTTSVAYLNSLCGPYHYAYSGVSQYYQDIPVYSWTINAMTHEMGHALGSPHTHACVWNGNNTPIDGCGPAAGYNEGCTGPLPSSGTIMSYCHLLSNVGINLANGFGTQPAQLIQNTINAKPCLGTNCLVSNCMANVSDLSFNTISMTGTNVTLTDNISSNWRYRVYLYNDDPWSANWNYTSSKTFNISNLLPNTYYFIEAGNVCSSGATIGWVRRMFLTDGDYCNGDEFVDTGGKFYEYDDATSFVKTFYPDVNGTLTMTFTDFDLEFNYDFMTIYDGENTGAPIFINGNNLTGNTIPGPFVSTNPTGAITVEFTSDMNSTDDGWEANFTCIPLSSTEFESVSAIVVYPNPSSSTVNIEAKWPIHGLNVYDMTGRLIMEKNEIGETKTSLELNSLSNGTYFIRIDTGKSLHVERIIKQ